MEPCLLYPPENELSLIIHYPHQLLHFNFPYCHKIQLQKTPYFKPTRGLLQENPLSPLLFIICMQSFSALIQVAEQKHWWVTAFKSRRILPISHLIFAYDIIVFSKASPRGLQDISTLLSLFQQATGKEINLSKSQLIFNAFASQQFKNNSALGAPEASRDTLYLGLPIPLGRRKLHLFIFLLQRVKKKKTEGWTERSVTRAGKLVMIKFVIQSLPIHIMSCIRIPSSILKQLTAAVTNFLWNTNQNNPEYIGYLGLLCVPISLMVVWVLGTFLYLISPY